MTTATTLTVHTETDVENVYSVGIHGSDMLYSDVPIDFNNYIRTTVTKSPHAVTEWIQGVRGDGTTWHRQVGFEVEVDYRNGHFGTAQFCVGNWCLVFQLGDNNWPPSLEQFLCDRDKFTFVGTQVEWKMRTLTRQLLGEQRQRQLSPIMIRDLSFFDIMLYTRKIPILLSVSWPGELQDLHWARNSNLSHVQVHYACLDAFLNLHIAKCLDRPPN